MELLLLCNNLDKSCGHKYCVSGDMFLICHQTLLEYTFKEVYGFMGGSPSHWVPTLPFLALSKWRYQVFNISRHPTKPHNITNFMNGSSSWYATTLPSLIANRYCSSRGMYLVCHVIKQDHAIKASDDNTIGAPQGKSQTCKVWLSLALQ